MALAMPRAFGQSEVEEPDLGRLPESFDMALDSLLNARYKEYYSLSKPHRQASKRELESKDQLYRDRLAQMESAIPLTYNPAVREAIDLYVNRRSNLMSLMLSRATYYFPIIEEELDRQGLPLELKYLAIVESALNPTAVSRMGATGFWQFMLCTGKIYGLTINSVIDERMDPRKSTRAMCEYFKDMYALYGDWMLAIAAYNCGPGNINKAIRRSGVLPGARHSPVGDPHPDRDRYGPPRTTLHDARAGGDHQRLSRYHRAAQSDVQEGDHPRQPAVSGDRPAGSGCDRLCL